MLGQHTLRRPILVLGFALALFLAAGSLLLPQGPDQAMFAWVGSVILDGGVPYKEAWEIKGPLTHYIYAFALALFGQRDMAIRIFDLFAILGGCWLLRKLVLRLNGNDEFGASCAVIFFCSIYYAGGYADTAQPEGWGGILIIAAVGLLLAPTPRPNLTMATVGALIGLATLIKPTFLLYTALPCVHVLTSPAQRERRPGVLVWCLLSFGAVIGGALLLLFLAGGLDDFLEMLGYLYTTYGHLKRKPLPAALGTLPLTLLHVGLLVPYLLAPFGLRFIRSIGSAREAAMAGAWLSLATIAVIIQGRYWQDHWLPAAMALAAILGVVCTRISCRLFTAERPNRVRAVWGLLILLAALAPPAGRALSANYGWPRYVLGAQSYSRYVTEVTKPFNEVRDPFNYLTMQQLADDIARRTRPEDRLAIWGWDVSVFSMSGRKSATRFGVFQPLVQSGPVQSRYQQIFLDELASQAPLCIVIDTRGAWFMKEGAGLRYLAEFARFDEFLRRHYRLASVVDVYQVWTLVG